MHIHYLIAHRLVGGLHLNCPHVDHPASGGQTLGLGC
jgi:hypothetical protein